MDLIEVSKAEEWFNNSKHGKGRIAGFVPMLMAEYAEHYLQSKKREIIEHYALFMQQPAIDGVYSHEEYIDLFLNQ